MSVKLIAKTVPVIDGINTAEELVAYCARVSNPANQDNHSTANKLLKYLAKNKHWSPFEMVSLTMEIECSRAIGRQILRHRSFHFQEFSQRYAEVDESMFEKVEARLQDQKNRQNSIKTENKDLSEWWEETQDSVIYCAIADYKEAVSRGIAKEQARVLLPEGLTKSRMYMSGTLRDWIFYCQLRMGHGTQAEHQEIAAACWDIVLTEFECLENILGE